VFSVKLQGWAHRVVEFPTCSVLQVNVTARSQCSVKGFLFYSDQLKKEGVKCVSTFKFRYSSLVILGATSRLSSTYKRLPLLFKRI
jgi:hypothetical protein